MIKAEIISESRDGKRAQLVVRSGAYKGTHHARLHCKNCEDRPLKYYLGKPDKKTGEQLEFVVEKKQ